MSRASARWTIACRPQADDPDLPFDRTRGLDRKRSAVHSFASQLRALGASGGHGYDDVLAGESHWRLSLSS